MIIALIALIAFIAMPVQAWTQLTTFTKGNPSGSDISQGDLYITNAAAFAANVTRFRYDGDCKTLNSIPTTGSRAITFRDPAGNAIWGNATFSYDVVNSDGSYHSGCFYQYDIIDYAGTTGVNTIYFSNGRHAMNDFPDAMLLYTPDTANSTQDSNVNGAVMGGWSGSFHYGTGTFTTFGGSNVVAPVASFSCTPTSQYPDTSVVCTDTSTNSPTSWLWTIDAEAMGIDAWKTHTGQNFTWESHYPGLYSVNLQATNTAGSDWENKTNYVSISVNATPNNCEIEPIPGYIRTYAQTNDGMTSGGIYNSNIQMHDMEGGAWSNVTNSGGWWCIDTLPGHSLNIYAQATGYTSAETLGASANGGRHYLVMWPDYIPAPSAGNVTLYALVYDQQTGAPLYLSMVRVDGNTINTVLTTTGPEGQAMFTIKNDTSIHVTASKTGYSSITKVITTSHFGPDTVMISLPRLTVTTIPTATTGPGGTTPVYVDPNDPSLRGGDTSLKAQEMMNWIAMNGMTLVQLCFLVTVLALLGVKLGK
jgi:PKD repeat protein